MTKRVKIYTRQQGDTFIELARRSDGVLFGRATFMGDSSGWSPIGHDPMPADAQSGAGSVPESKLVDAPERLR